MKEQKVSQSIMLFAGISFANQAFNDSGLLYLKENYIQFY